MPRAYVLSHGARVGNYLETFVPAGKSISFYSEFDENTLRVNGLAAFNAGDISPTETLTGPCPVANYVHSTFEDDAIAQHIASESSASGGKPYYVGSDLPDGIVLCTTPKVCVTTYPQHADGCTGVFKRVTEDEIYSVACRGLSGAKNQATREMDGSTDLLDDNQAEAKRILDWAQTDGDAAMAYWQSLTQATRVSLSSSYTPLQRYAEQYFQTGGEAIPEAVLEAQRYLEAYGEETFFDWVWTMDPAGRQRQLILHDDQLGAVFERQSRTRLGLPETPLAGPDQFLDSARLLEQQVHTLATAVDQLTGSEDDSNAVSEIGELYSVIMTELQTAQTLAGQIQDRLQYAVGAASAGANLGPAIAVYGESPDEENLAGLRSGTVNLLEWISRMTEVAPLPGPDAMAQAQLN
jgi:hypothetical protein